MKPRGRHLRHRTFFIFSIFALLGLLSGFLMVYLTKREPHPAPIPFQPAKSPFQHFIAADALVESHDEDLFVSPPFSEIVEKVWVATGDNVKKGDPLYKMTDIMVQKDLLIAEREYDITLAQYQRQLALPRAEDVPSVIANVQEKKASYQEALERYELYQNITNERAVSIDERNTKKYASFVSKYQFEEAEADLKKLLAGAWEKDLAITKAELAQKKARVDRVQAELERYVVRAPIDGVILKINIGVGEYVLASGLPDPPLIMGRLDVLYLRVNVVEEEIWRVERNANGVAFVRGNSSLSTPIEFVRIDPFAIPKRILSGNQNEIVDTRTLPVIYKFPRGDMPVYPGQLMDVFLEAKPYIR